MLKGASDYTLFKSSKNVRVAFEIKLSIEESIWISNFFGSKLLKVLKSRF